MQVTKQILDVEKIREDFPSLKNKVYGKALVYLDNGATTLCPQVVIDSMTDFYSNYKANVHRGIHALSEKASEAYEKAHQIVADFINAEFEEIVFTRGTTESLNLVAYSLTSDLKKGDEIVVSEMEHHSNLVPWQQLAKERGLVLKYILVKEDGTLDLVQAKKIINKRTKVVAVTNCSNLLGTINDVKEIGKIAHANGSLIVVDAAQSVPHMKIDVKDYDCDFLAFSGHKMCGPTGIGVLYGKKELLEKLKPFNYGGGMISQVTYEDTKWNDLPWKFEAGTPAIGEAIGLGKAIEYLDSIGMDKIREYEEYLTEYALEKFKILKNVKVFGPKDVKIRGGVISFYIEGLHPHDISEVLDKKYGIAVRGGHMCVQPYVTQRLKVNAVTRASLYFYNTTQEIDLLIEGLKHVMEMFNGRKHGS